MPPEVFELVYRGITKYKELVHINNLTRNKKFRNMHKGKRCFIIGNGPSINNIDLTKLNNEYTFVANHFFLHKDIKKIKPNYYCLIDREHFKKTENSKKFFKKLESAVNNDVNFFLPINYKVFVQQEKYLKDFAKHYLLLEGKFTENLKFNIEIDKAIPNIINVVLSCIILAKYMGFKEIYLLGVDHDWLKARTFDKIKRFYKKHHFDNDRKNTYEYAASSTGELFRAYRLLKIKLAPTTIINCTTNSYIDVFEFDKLDNVLKKK